MGSSNCHICQSQYIFGDQGNEYQVTSQTWWTQTLVKAPLITWSTEPMMKSLVVNLDPVLSSPWNVWEFPFPQWTVTQVHSLDPFGEALGKSLCIAEFFALELSHLFSQWYQVWKLRKRLLWVLPSSSRSSILALFWLCILSSVSWLLGYFAPRDAVVY